MAQFPTTLIFEAGSTTTITDTNISGVDGGTLTLKSSVRGTQYTLSKDSGTVTTTYTKIEDSNATGGAIWDATSRTNYNFGNNTGWDFAVIPVTGEFFSFF
jgi:hypothetical protein